MDTLDDIAQPVLDQLVETRWHADRSPDRDIYEDRITETERVAATDISARLGVSDDTVWDAINDSPEVGNYALDELAEWYSDVYDRVMMLA